MKQGVSLSGCRAKNAQNVGVTCPFCTVKTFLMTMTLRMFLAKCGNKSVKYGNSLPLCYNRDKLFHIGDIMPKRVTIKDLIGLKPKEANFVIEFCKDFAPRRAAEASGYSADHGYKLLTDDNISAAVDHVLEQRLEASHIDAEWVLMEAVDNHLIARQQGNIPASTSALNLVAKHVFVDAFAAEKVEVAGDKEIMERLIRGRKRMNEENDDSDGVSFI